MVAFQSVWICTDARSSDAIAILETIPLAKGVRKHGIERSTLLM